MEQKAVIRAVCISEKKGEQKHPVDRIELRPRHGILGDAHAGDWHRQVSLLAKESVDRLQEKVSIRLFPGAFAENILCEGIALSALPVGTKLRIGTALCEVTRLAKNATPTVRSDSRPETVSCRGRVYLPSFWRRGKPAPAMKSLSSTNDNR